MVRRRTGLRCAGDGGRNNMSTMRRAGAALLLAICLAALRTACAAPAPAPSPACPNKPAGYDFFKGLEVANSVRLNATGLTNVTKLAESCFKTPRCTAFNSRGVLMTAPLRTALSYLDPNKTGPCDGVYLSNRTLTGLTKKIWVADELRENATVNNQNMVAAATAAKLVRPALSQKGIPITPALISAPSQQVAQVFLAAKVPLVQVSTVSGNYSYNAVAAAIVYPVWDSRAVNGSSRSLISPVKNQAECGSCVAFAAAAGAEAAVAAAGSAATNTKDFSEQWLFFCNGLYNPTCDTGWTADEAAEVLKQKSIPVESYFPYRGAASACPKPNATKEDRPKGTFSWVTITNLDTAKAHIRQYGSVLTYFAVYNDFYNWNKNSLPYVWDGKSALSGYHQVLCIGYNDTGLYWIAKNSWGTTWGDNGYFRMSYTNRAGFMSASGDNVVGLKFTPSAPPTAAPPPTRPPPRRPPSPPPSPPPRRPSPPPSKSPLPSPRLLPSPPRRPPPARPPPPRPSPSAPRRPPSQPPAPPPPACGDSRCNGNETCASCPRDCGACPTCGDNICSGGETCRTCPRDCGIKQANGLFSCCGDGVCAPGDNETCATCRADCGACPMCNNNGVCEALRYNETCYNATTKYGCANDCGTCGAARCGDGICSFATSGYSESCTGCSRDCGKCNDALYCGDGICSSERGETKTTCSRDCVQVRKLPPPPPPDVPNPPDWLAPPPLGPDYDYDYDNDYSYY